MGSIQGITRLNASVNKGLKRSIKKLPLTVNQRVLGSSPRGGASVTATLHNT